MISCKATIIRNKPGNELDREHNAIQVKDAFHIGLAITAKMTLQHKHVNHWCRNTFFSLLVIRGEFEARAIETQRITVLA